MTNDTPERLVRLETKMDFLINEFSDFKSFQSKLCESSTAQRNALFARVDSLRAFKTYVTGAWAVLCILGAIVYDLWKTRGFKP